MITNKKFLITGGLIFFGKNENPKRFSCSKMKGGTFFMGLEPW
ncbi:hypothetical protein BD94_3014 [Elizabethkingia anophelis NUHP1]|uniref:Uncharacterized protein n=1 Tax=Elizabethkingia anophelis NUHP1 TaxID=1338011 RepID=A0A077EKL4_9FLAO|nr:hypothetical protein BD94_3014 [Elizabethkingia anophelis NUHP1]